MRFRIKVEYEEEVEAESEDAARMIFFDNTVFTVQSNAESFIEDNLTVERYGQKKVK